MAESPGVRDRPHPAMVWVIVLGAVFVTETAVMVLLPIVLPDDRSRFLETAVDSVMLTIIVAPLLWWLIVRPLQEADRMRDGFLADLFTSIEADRRQTAHDLHDGVGQSLTLLVSGLRTAHEAIPDPDLARRCRELCQLAQQALADVKRLALGLRPSLLDDLGLAPALERLTADVQANHPIAVTLHTAGLGNDRLPGTVETAVFRIVQEAMSNVVRHANAGRATVTVRRHNGSVTVEVGDDGKGIAPEMLRGRNPGHLGLTGMRERATLLGGELAITSVPGRGTQITATLPIGGKL